MKAFPNKWTPTVLEIWIPQLGARGTLRWSRYLGVWLWEIHRDGEVLVDAEGTKLKGQALTRKAARASLLARVPPRKCPACEGKGCEWCSEAEAS